MNKLINKVKSLHLTHANRIKTYNGVDNVELFEKIENILGMKFNGLLKEIFIYSNGISFIDYCFMSINNRKMANILQYNLSLWKEHPSLKGKYIAFITTTIGLEYGFHIDENNEYIKIAVREKDQITFISNSFEDYFELFLDKIETTLNNMGRFDFVKYFDDESLPNGTNDWNFKKGEFS